MSCLVGVVGMLYRRRPRTRTILPTMKFELKLVPPGRYGNGFDIMYTDNGTATPKLSHKLTVALRYQMTLNRLSIQGKKMNLRAPQRERKRLLKIFSPDGALRC